MGNYILLFIGVFNWKCNSFIGCGDEDTEASKEVLGIIHRINGYWQTNHPGHGCSFGDNTVYHTGNMEAYFLTGKLEYLEYSKKWAEHNKWKGAESDNKTDWKYSYGESDDYVLFMVMPVTDKYRQEYIGRFHTLAKSVAVASHPKDIGRAVCSTRNMRPDRKRAGQPFSLTVCNGE